MIDTQAIRSKILDLAMRGQLAEQLPEDGTAEELYQQIQAEKQELIRAGKIKKEKPLPEITEKDTPFDIPKSWNYVKLQDISSVISKGTTPRGGKVSYSEKGIGFLRAENLMGYDGINASILRYVDEQTHYGFLKRSILEAGDILVSIAGTLGKTGLVREEYLPLNTNQAIAFVRVVNREAVELRFIVYALNSTNIQKALLNKKVDMAIPNLSLNNISNIVIPFPPLAEQKRIVEKIDQAFSVLDAIDTLQAQYANNLTALKAKLINAAIQGKLTEQLPEDGTAEELYQQVQAEKQALTKAGKIKKEKSLPEITEDEIPFEIPENWKWVTLGNITMKITSGSTPTGGRKSNVYVESGFPLFREQNIYDDGIHQAGMVFITEELLNTRQNSTVLAKDILLNITGGSIGRCALVPDNFDRGSINQHILIIRTVDPETRFYIHMLICSPYVQSYIKNNAVGDKDGFSGGRCKKILVPLPPLNEQKRIVETLDRLLSNMGQ